MSSLMPPEFRKLRSSGSPITINPPVRACRMLSIPSRSAVPGAIISRALISPGSGLTSLSKSSPDRGATIFHSRAFSVPLAAPTGGRRAGSGGRRGGGALGDRQLSAAGAAGRQSDREGLAQPRDLAGAGAALRRGDHLAEPVLRCLLQAPLGMPHPAQLTRQAQLAE